MKKGEINTLYSASPTIPNEDGEFVEFGYPLSSCPSMSIESEGLKPAGLL